MVKTLRNNDELEYGILCGDESAWERFVQRYSRLIWSSIHKALKLSSFPYTREDAEDIYSSLFVSLIEDDFRSLRQFQARNACQLSTWLTIVTVRKAIDHKRRQRFRLQSTAWREDGPPVDTVADTGKNAEQMLVDADEQASLAKSLGALSTGDRAIYELLYQQGLSPQDAARAMGISTAAVYTRKNRLIERIKKSL